MPNKVGANNQPVIFVAGMQRTGTNFTQELINFNFESIKATWPNIWWKHDSQAITRDAIENNHVAGVVLVIKHPYTWVESICYRKPADIANAKLNRDYNIREPGNTTNGINVKNALRLYKDFYCNWLKVDPLVFVHYEDLLNDQGRQNFFKDLQYKFGISVDPSKIRVPTDVPWSSRRTLGCLENYQNYLAPLLTDTDIQLINKVLRSDFFKTVGYNRKKV